MNGRSNDGSSLGKTLISAARADVQRLKVLSVTRIFGKVIRRNVRGESVGALFEFWPIT